MKNIFYLFAGLALVAHGQPATAGWYDDVGASVLTAQQAETLPDSGTIVDQAPKKIELGKPGIQAESAVKNEPVDDAPPMPPEPIVDHSISDVPMIDSEPRQAPVASDGPTPLSDPTPAVMTETAPHSIVQPADPVRLPVHHHHHRHVPKKKNLIQKLIECERKKNAWIKQTLFGH